MSDRKRWKLKREDSRRTGRFLEKRRRAKIKSRRTEYDSRRVLKTEFKKTREIC